MLNSENSKYECLGKLVMKNLVGTKNAGFTIVKQGSEAVIGVRERDNLHVAWNYDFDKDGEPYYYWGRYGSEDYADEKYGMKESGYYSGD